MTGKAATRAHETADVRVALGTTGRRRNPEGRMRLREPLREALRRTVFAALGIRVCAVAVRVLP